MPGRDRQCHIAQVESPGLPGHGSAHSGDKPVLHVQDEPEKRQLPLPPGHQRRHRVHAPFEILIRAFAGSDGSFQVADMVWIASTAPVRLPSARGQGIPGTPDTGSTTSTGFNTSMLCSISLNLTITVAVNLTYNRLLSPQAIAPHLHEQRDMGARHHAPFGATQGGRHECTQPDALGPTCGRDSVLLLNDFSFDSPSCPKPNPVFIQLSFIYGSIWFHALL